MKHQITIKNRRNDFAGVEVKRITIVSANWTAKFVPFQFEVLVKLNLSVFRSSPHLFSLYNNRAPNSNQILSLNSI